MRTLPLGVSDPSALPTHRTSLALPMTFRVAFGAPSRHMPELSLGVALDVTLALTLVLAFGSFESLAFAQCVNIALVIPLFLVPLR